MKSKKIYLILLLCLLCINLMAFRGKFISLDEKNQNLNVARPNLADTHSGNYTIPGVSDLVSLSQVFKIGILGDLDDITGDHSWKGAMLAAREINEAGGLLINSTNYYIGFKSEDTDEAEANLNVAKGVSAAIRLVSYDKPHCVIGGFRTESLSAYQEVIMDQLIPFICVGCPEDQFCQNVIDSYSRYKYFFRITPINTTAYAIELTTFIADLADYLSTTYGGNATKIEIIREDLTWTIPLYMIIDVALTALNLSVSVTTIPITLLEPYLGGILSALDVSGTQIVIPLVSGHLGSYLGYYYGLLKPKFMLAGLNYRGQSDIYWDDTKGGAQYEIVMQTAYNTSKTPLTIPFWNNFFEEYNEEPYFTALGSYDAVRLLANAALENQTFNSNSLISNLESKDTNNPFIGASNNIAFLNSHDIVEGWPYGTSMFCQWKMDGNKDVVPSWNKIYPNAIATGSISIPYWGLNDLVEDNTYRLPGNFTLSSDADANDPDGTFNLEWTSSEGANYYSVYYAEDPITYISKRYTTLVGKSVDSPITITNLENGEYYFIAVAYNGTGQKFSNYIHITVNKGVSGYDIILVLSLISLVAITIIYKKHRKIK
ncbi:MAG: ABC transporter substrate-binding protein [Candidatus Hermodarchaeota archaeon]